MMDLTLVFEYECKFLSCFLPAKLKQLPFFLIIRSKGAFQSYYVGTSRKTKEKVTIKEHHINKYPDDSCAIKEIFILSHLSHTVIPHLQEVFISNKSSIFLVSFFFFQKPRTLFNDISHQPRSIGDGIY